VSKVNDLIAQLCPGGVEHTRLGDLGQFIRGRRITKDDFVESGVGCIHYGEIYTRSGTTAAETFSFVRPELAARLRLARRGDLIIAATGENAEEVCKAVAWLGPEEIAIHDDCYLYRHSFDPTYISYLFQSSLFHDQKIRFAAGAKMVRVSGEKLAKIRVPVPPLPVQREVVEILNRFESLEAELAEALRAEQEARRQQYVHYRDSLLAFEPRERERVRWAVLTEIGTLYGGLSSKTKADFKGGNARFVSYVNVFNNVATATAPEDRVAVGEGERQNRVRFGDVLFTASSENPEDAGMSSAVTVEPQEPLYLNSFCFGFRPNAPRVLDPEFAKHLFRSGAVRRQIVRTANGVTRFNIAKARFEQVEIPIPGLAEQALIAAVLDRLDALVEDLSVGLPAEVRARRQQYAHYRDRLLSFEQAAA